MEIEEDGEEGSGSDSDSDSESEDDEDEDEEPDLELRSKLEAALRSSGIGPADDSEGEGDSEEEVMDDDQMMAIDDQLAEIFKSRTSEKKGGKGKMNVLLLQFVYVDSPGLQTPMHSVRLPTSRTAFLTSWTSTSRSSHPALISRF